MIVGLNILALGIQNIQDKILAFSIRSTRHPKRFAKQVIEIDEINTSYRRHDYCFV